MTRPAPVQLVMEGYYVTTETHLAELRTYIEALERDAARWRWLIDPANGEHEAWDVLTDTDATPEQMTAAVDAALSAEKGESRTAPVCPNCDTPVPPGCDGVFGSEPQCRLSAEKEPSRG